MNAYNAYRYSDEGYTIHHEYPKVKCNCTGILAVCFILVWYFAIVSLTKNGRAWMLFFLGVCDNLDLYNYWEKPIVVFLVIYKIISVDYLKTNRLTRIIVIPFDMIIHVKGRTLTPSRFLFTIRFKKWHWHYGKQHAKKS